MMQLEEALEPMMRSFRVEHYRVVRIAGLSPQRALGAYGFIAGDFSLAVIPDRRLSPSEEAKVKAFVASHPSGKFKNGAR